MSTSQVHSSPQASVSGSLWELVERVAGSPEFERSVRLRGFLLYVCERALQNRSNEITEQQIGIHVFGRPSNYNSGDDNIVRVQARLLRWKLDEYFAGAGALEPVTIAIPKGTYVPVFEPRVQKTPPVLASPVDAGPRPLFGVTPANLVLIVLVVILSAACAWLLAGRRTLAAVTRAATPFGTVWNSFLGDNRHTVVVSPDETLGLLEIATQQVIPLNTYLASDFQEQARAMSQKSGLDAIVPNFVAKDLASTAVAVDVSMIAAMPRAPSATLDVRSARVLNINELSNGSAILIGVATNNPWIQLFDKRLNFGFSWDRNHKNYCINRHPKPGEKAEYDSAPANGFRTVYSGVAWLPSLRGRGDVLLVLGAGPGNKMAAEFITNEKLSGAFLARLKSESKRSVVPYFEVVLRTTVFKTESATTQVEAYRILPSEMSPDEASALTH